MTTLVELFDRSPIENIIGSLALKPDVTVFVGTDVRRMQRALPAYEAILRGRGIKTELLVRSAARSDLESTVAVLDALLDDRSDEPDEVCAVDISGGDETALLAVGAILLVHFFSEIPIVTFSLWLLGCYITSIVVESAFFIKKK